MTISNYEYTNEDKEYTNKERFDKEEQEFNTRILLDEEQYRARLEIEGVPFYYMADQ